MQSAAVGLFSAVVFAEFESEEHHNSSSSSVFNASLSCSSPGDC